jgi:hypothetical protein
MGFIEFLLSYDIHISVDDRDTLFLLIGSSVSKNKLANCWFPNKWVCPGMHGCGPAVLAAVLTGCGPGHLSSINLMKHIQDVNANNGPPSPCGRLHNTFYRRAQAPRWFCLIKALTIDPNLITRCLDLQAVVEIIKIFNEIK